MTNRLLIDTNILVYAYDRSEPVKQRVAAALLNHLEDLEAGVVTTQVLGELFVTLIGKLSAQYSADQAYERIDSSLNTWEVLDVTRPVIMDAIRAVREYKMHYWDAQLWAAARLHTVPVILSEDFSDGAVIEGVRFVNPFTPEFRLDEWL